MFTLPSQQNPLDLLLSSTSSEIVQKGIQQREQQREINELQKLSELNEESSPLEWFKAINKTKLSPEKKEKLYDMPFRLEKNRIDKLKSDNSQKVALEKGSNDEKSIGIIRDTFGEDAAKIWEASTTGGRTDLLKTMLDAQLRGDDVAKILSGVKVREGEKPEIVDAAVKTAITGKQVYPKLDVFSGLKPNEVPAFRKSLRKENSSIYQEARKKSDAADKEIRSVGILDKINEKPDALPKGLGRIVINPMTGQPWAVAQLFGLVSPDTQRWVKTINDFTTRAKESYGARVTNFDLQQFMARLPGLLNSPEGRRVILGQMRIIAEMDALHSNALKDVYRHYGADKITAEQADEIAENFIENDKERLQQELDRLDQESDTISENLSQEAQIELPNASENKGRRLMDEETGKIFISDGVSWRPQNG